MMTGTLGDGFVRIAVFRALQLGDMLCAVPALRALRRGEPYARITLIGLPWAREFASRFNDYVDDFIEFPGAPGLTDTAPDDAALARFYDTCRARRFDLAIQLHGSGTHSNAVVAALGAARTAGFVPGNDAAAGERAVSAESTAALDHTIPWPDDLPEIRRYLLLTSRLGYDDWGEHLEFPLGGLDYAIWRVLCDEHALDACGYAVIHPGARMPSRRWPAERFAGVARQLAQLGMKIVVTGTRAESPLVEAFAAAFGAPFVDLCGQTPLGTLAALVGRARLVVCNDTGVSHIAAALGTPSVVVACGSDDARWAPLDRERHRVLANHPPCRPCMFDTCPYDHVCATAIGIDDVAARARELLAAEDHHVS